MNKKLCKETRKRGKWKRIMCAQCRQDKKPCTTREEYDNGHSDELRDKTNEEINNPVDYR